MAKGSMEEREGGFGLLFGDTRSSDEDSGDEVGPALVEEEYTRPSPAPPLSRAEAGGAAVPPKLRLSLVSSRHSLWGHRLWNAALLLAEMFDKREINVEGKSVLELGAGAGLPSLICALRGARKVVISDYATSTDTALMVPIQINIDRVQPKFVPNGTLHAVGHVWGHGVEDLFVPLLSREQHPQFDRDNERGRDENAEPEHRPPPAGGAVGKREGGETGGRGEYTPEGFDTLILADLLFNRSQHAQLLDTCDRCLRSGPDAGTAWVSFSHHDPEKTELDMKFFALANERGFAATRIKTVQMRDLFVENDGMDDLRGEVHLWCLKRDG